MINAKESITGVVQTKQTLTGVLNKAIEYVEPVTQEKTVTPTKEVQEVMPDENYTGLSKVIVNAYEPIVGEKKITKNGTYKAIDENLDGYSKVEVEVAGGVDIWDYYVKGYNYSEISQYIKTIPLIDTSKMTSMRLFFNSCYNLISIPQLDTSKVTDMRSTFVNCFQLTGIPQLDTSKVTNMYMIFSGCSNLIEIPLLDMSSVTSVYYCVENCYKLENLGGFKNLGQAYSTTSSANYTHYGLILLQSNQLTHDSLMNVINNLYDIATKGCNTQQLVLGSTNLAKLTAEEVAIATNKGWSVS